MIFNRLLKILNLNQRNNKKFLNEKFDVLPTLKQLPPPEDPFRLPESTDDFKEWHYRALRRLRNHPVNEPFSGKVATEVDYDSFITIAQNFGLIEVANFEKTLKVLKNDTLKQILRHYNLKVSGNKRDLVKRITDNINETDLRNTELYSDIFLVTPKGESLISNSYRQLENDNINFFKTTVDLIVRNNLDEAYRIICKKNAEIPFPPGLNCEWKKEYYKGLGKNKKSFYEKQLNESKDKLIKAAVIYSSMSGETSRNTSRLLFCAYNIEAELNIQTNGNSLSTKTNFNSYEDAAVKRYCFCASLDLRTCPVCAELDGKIFNVSEKQIGVNCPPMHEGCRCTTIAVVSDELFAKLGQRFRDPVTGKIIKVDKALTYKEWYAKYVKGRSEAEQLERQIKGQSIN